MFTIPLIVLILLLVGLIPAYPYSLLLTRTIALA